MSQSFSIEMLPAREGDCLLISYDDASASRRRHVLIDAGRAGTWPELKARLLDIPEAERELELLVVTHVDRDHIEGVLKMIEDPGCPVTFKDIWFNGYRHLVEDESFGPVQGERLTTALLTRPWNVAFAGKAVCIPASGELPVWPLDGGLTLTVVSPTRAKLAALEPVWVRDCEEAGLDPNLDPHEGLPGEESFGPIDVDAAADTPSKKDATEANGSSIALLAEYGGRRVLLGADAHPEVLIESLTRLGNGEPVELTACKIAHHGSSGNTTQELLAQIRCPRYLISTSGAHYKHPHRIAVARIVKYGQPEEIVFNYRSKYTDEWDDTDLMNDWGYQVRYCDDGQLGTVLIEL